MSVEQRQSEFYSDPVIRNKRARELRQGGWSVSVGQMRREDGRDYYIRLWRRSEPAATTNEEVRE